MKFKITADEKKMEPKKQRYGRYMWIKEEIKAMKSYTDIPCTEKKKEEIIEDTGKKGKTLIQ